MTLLSLIARGEGKREAGLIKWTVEADTEGVQLINGEGDTADSD